MRVNPQVSVIVAAHNEERFIDTCMESVLSQVIPGSSHEVLVVNDGSEDSTPRLLERYGNGILRIDVPENRGLAAACNEGLRRAQGEFVVRVDADDWLEADALAKMASALKAAPKADILLPDYWEVWEGRDPVRKRMEPQNVFSWTAAGPMIRRDALERAGGYRPLFWEEFDLYLRLLASGSTAQRLEEPLMHYRRHGAGMTANPRARREGWQELLIHWPRQILLRYGNDPELESVLEPERVG